MLVGVLVAAIVATTGGHRTTLPFTGPGSLVVTAAPWFEFHSDFWINLHHFLYVQGRAQHGDDALRPSVTRSLTDTSGIGSLSIDDRRAWSDAQAYYAAHVIARDALFDSGMVAFKAALVADTNGSLQAAARIDPAMAGALQLAAPVYRAHWWPAHDSANRAWISAMKPLLDRHAASIGAQVTRAFRTPWPATVIRVDVSPYANWAGAYTTNAPNHIMMSSVATGYGSSSGLEMLFHEAMHTFDDSLEQARLRHCPTRPCALTYDVTHALIFYTAGTVTAAVVPGHIPYMVSQGLVNRSSLAPMFPVITTYWQPYLDRRIPFDSAYDAIARIIGRR